jgi:hypothetical protein
MTGKIRLSHYPKGGSNIKGIQFVLNDKGDHTAVIINLKKHGDLWEDFYDSLTAKQRKDEPRETLDTVKKNSSKRANCVGNYSVTFARSARRELEILDIDTVTKIFHKIEGLSDECRPQGCRKLKECTNLWRGGRVCLDSQKRFISDKLSVHAATFSCDNIVQ